MSSAAPGAVEDIATSMERGDALERRWAVEALSRIGERGVPGAWAALRGRAAVEADPEVQELLRAVLR